MSDRVSFTATVRCCYCGKLMGKVPFCWPRADFEAEAARGGDFTTHGICPECCAIELTALDALSAGGPLPPAA